MTFKRLIQLALCSLLAACSATPAAFSTRFPDNQNDDVNRLMARLSQTTRRNTPNIAVGVARDPLGLYAYDLDAQRVLWQQAASLSGTPILAGTQVVVQDNDRIVGRDLSTGQSLFAVAAGDMKLIGADGEGRATVLVLSRGQGTLSRSRVVMLEGGSVRWDIPFEFQGGAPALAGDTVLVPWGNQYLSGLTRADGEEIARIRVSDGVLSQAFVEGDHAYVGSEEGVARVEPSLAHGQMRKADFMAAPEQELPGRPSFLRNVYRRDEVLGPDSARHSISVTWSPARAGNGQLGVDGGVIYLVFYRFVFALSYPTLTLHWVHTHPSDLVGAQGEPGGILLVDNGGRFTLLSRASGSPTALGSSDRPTTAGVLPRAVAFPVRNQAIDADAVRKQLVLAAQDPDTRLVPVRRMSVKLLAEIPGEEATRDLLTLCESERSAPAVSREACDALGSRSAGTGDLVAALARHFDYLEQTTPAPVGALAAAAAQQGKREAFDPLVSHLNDPQTPSADLASIVAALFKLDAPAAVEPVSAFARLYHADGMDEFLVKALQEAVRGLATVGSEEALATLRALADDELSLRSVREKANAMLSEYEKSQRMKEQQAAQAESGEEEQPAAVDEPKGPPKHLTLALVDQTLRPVRRELLACLTSSGRNDFRARVILVVEDDQLQLVSVLPKELQGCVEPIIRSRPFPKTLDATRQQLSYTISRK